MDINLVAINAVISLVLFPLILAAIFKRNWKHTKYLWLAVSVLGTASLALELYLGAGTVQYVLNLILVAFALLNTYRAFNQGKKI